jgi:hypothetical protein
MRMKLLTVSVISLLLSLYSSAQVRWDGGGGDGLWENPLNWESDILPATTDDVLLDNGLVGGNYIVTLPTGAVNTSISTLTVTPTGANTIRLIIPVGNTENPALTVTGAGDALILNTGGILQNSSGLVAPGTAILVTNTFRINNGGRYIHNSASANNSIVSRLSTQAGTETGIFEYNVPVSTSYEIAAAGQTYGTLILSAVASGNSNYTISAGATPVSVHGDFRINANAHLVNSSATGIVIDGNLRLFANSSFDLSSANNSPVLSVKGNFNNSGAITESGSGNPTIELIGTGTYDLTATGTFSGDNLDVVVNRNGTVRMTTSIYLPDDLTVQSGTIDIADGVFNDTLGIKGDLQVSGTITESGTAAPLILLNGTSNQNLSMLGSGSISGDLLDFALDNPAGSTLLSDVLLPYTFTLKRGNLTIGNYSLSVSSVVVPAQASLPSNHIITNGTGFLTIRNVGTAVVTFPVGVDATSVNPIDMSDGGGLSYSVRAVEGIYPQDISNPLLAVDRTWIINSSGIPPGPVSVTFYYYTGQGGTGFNYGNAVDVGQYLTSVWNIAAANASKTYNSTYDQYRASAKLNSFNTSFIIGNHGAILPIDFFIACKALKNNESGIITWEIENSENVLSFEVEKSVDNSPFKSIGSVEVESKKLEYTFDDRALNAGSNLYRIKSVLLDGEIKYSNTVAVIHKVNKVLVTSVSPNPVQSTTRITISSPARTAMRFTLHDMQGKILKQWQQALSEGTNTMSLQMDNFRSGIYFLSASDGNIKTNTVRIVKQ